MINVKVSKIEKYQGKLLKFDFEITCNAKYWWTCDAQFILDTINMFNVVK